MAERAGYDQPGDVYTEKNASFGVGDPPPYQPDPLTEQHWYPMQQGYGQQSGYGQQPYAQITNTTLVVTNQPQAGTVVNQPGPPNYMLSSILACLCCFWPTGLCAIYYACQASNLVGDGDYVGARRMASNARSLITISVTIGVIWITLMVISRIVLHNETYHY